MNTPKKLKSYTVAQAIKRLATERVANCQTNKGKAAWKKILQTASEP